MRMHEFGVRIRFIGDRDDPRVPDELRAEIEAAEDLTAGNSRMHLVFAFNYGGRSELGAAAERVAADVADGKLRAQDVDENSLAARLYLPEMPDPDLVIRTSGEMRTSNFLVWESAYSEYVFTPTLWPDFDRITLMECVAGVPKPAQALRGSGGRFVARRRTKDKRLKTRPSRSPAGLSSVVQMGLETRDPGLPLSSRPPREEIVFAARFRHDRQPGKKARLRLPIIGDLRRPALGIRLWPARCGVVA